MRAHVTSVLLSFLIISALSSCASVSQSSLINDWRHSYEEDTQQFKIYRPVGYEFPLGWGRSGMKIEPNGNFTLFYIAPNDAIATAKGKWQLHKNIFTVTYIDPERSELSLEIHQVDKTILKVKL